MSEPARAIEDAGPVIIGFDATECGEDALILGIRFGRTLGVTSIVAVVYPSPATISPARVDAEWVADRRRAAKAAIAKAREFLTPRAPDAAVEYVVVPSSSAAHGLSDLAAHERGSLIVVGSSGARGVLGRLFTGSTALRLLSGSRCPVAVAPRGLRGKPAGEIRRIGVAYVDTPEAQVALRQAARLAERTKVSLKLFSVVPHEHAAKPLLIGDDAEHALTATAREAYQRALDAAVESLPDDLEVTTEILEGDPVDVLAELGEDQVDVLFCGSRGYGPVRSVLLGGVSSRLLRKARSPVVVVPRSG